MPKNKDIIIELIQKSYDQKTTPDTLIETYKNNNDLLQKLKSLNGDYTNTTSFIRDLVKFINFKTQNSNDPCPSEMGDFLFLYGYRGHLMDIIHNNDNENTNNNNLNNNNPSNDNAEENTHLLPQQQDQQQDQQQNNENQQLQSDNNDNENTNNNNLNNNNVEEHTPLLPQQQDQQQDQQQNNENQQLQSDNNDNENTNNNNLNNNNNLLNNNIVNIEGDTHTIDNSNINPHLDDTNQLLYTQKTVNIVPLLGTNTNDDGDSSCFCIIL